ncbi:(-)-germacrene D synthase [Camellia lanceoleosa]|uniref:(-)-germacrene D synthase n=1 Tax=Camellia lanceoleosa TaxID=1840588 RepID=A0ACC0GF44_9ERIC|nr:(-)-germacrene D synthase [Camellia lanceoleosa]
MISAAMGLGYLMWKQVSVSNALLTNKIVVMRKIVEDVSPYKNKPNQKEEGRVKELQDEVRGMLSDARTEPLKETLILIDSLQRLGLSYDFEYEIEQALQSIYSTQINYGGGGGDDDLYMCALYFRLFRQQGYHVSSDSFKKFTDEKGEFKSVLKENARALLCLYEASHLRVQGEDILEEALKFTSKHLRSMLAHLNSPLSEQVKHSLEVPLHKGMPRLEARHYINVYQADLARNSVLLELAKLDFNLLQRLHQREISDITREIATKLPFARDRLVECYFWILGVYFEPKYSVVRSFMTKIIALASVIDDIYDVYGTLEELQLFTDAIERWEEAAISDLPEYMQVCFEALSEVMKEMEDKITTHEGRSYHIYYAKEGMKGLVRAYFVEANWFNTKYVPTFEEYLSISVMSSGYPMLAVQSLVGIGKIATKEAFDWVLNVPKIVESCALIARLVDDIQTHKVEQERGDAPSGVQCYMREHGVSEEEACGKIREIVDIAWKDINEELQNPNRLLPLPLLLPALNLSRMMEVIYGHGDGYTNSKGRTKDIIIPVLVNPISM